MKLRFPFLAVLFMTVIFTSSAIDLSHLDKVVAADFSAARTARIDSLRHLLGNTAIRDKIAYELSTAYSDFNVDSALYYALKAEAYAVDDSRRRKTMLRRGAIYNSSLMMYKEASELFDSIAKLYPDSYRDVDYYTLGVQLYRNLEMMTPDGGMRHKYALMKRAYRDSVLLFNPDAVLIRANAMLDDNHPEAALSLLQSRTKGKYKPSNGALYHVIARAYKMSGNTEQCMEYLALAAQSDIENGVREYMALPQLAQMLYERGDVDRAFNYMQRSVRDASRSKARIRMLDTSEAMSIISDAYTIRLHRANSFLIIILSVAVFLLISLLLSFYYVRRQNRRLGQLRREQELANSQLEAAGKVREKYVREFMNLSLEYLERMDRYRAGLFKTASQRNFDKLCEAIKSNAYIDKESASFYRNFDNAFIELYPHFVEELNQFLREEERFKINPAEGLTTELRIFALMKLGIGESADIARFLHCSQSTVYNYRTKMRRKAINAEEFVACTYLKQSTEPPTI